MVIETRMADIIDLIDADMASTNAAPTLLVLFFALRVRCNQQEISVGVFKRA
jgi:hypothetical protein